VRLVGQEFCDILVDRGWLKARASSDSTVSSEDYANVRNESLEEDLNCVEQAFRIEEEEDSRDSESWKKPLDPHLFPAFSDGTTASHTEGNSKLDDSHKAALSGSHAITLGAGQDLTDSERLLDEVPDSHGRPKCFDCRGRSQ
jgi:hypothetical protein